MKILSRRSGPARAEDVTGDGVVDDRDRAAAADRADARAPVTDRDEERTAYRSAERSQHRSADGERSAYRSADGERDPGADRLPDGERRPDPAAGAGSLATAPRRPGAAPDPEPALERTVDLDRDGRPDRPLAGPEADRRAAPVALGPRPRTSLLATLGLIVSVVGALFVLSGTLAGYGIGLGAVGAVLAVLGLLATRRRHVAGTTDALVGVVVGLAAVVLGVVAMTGRFDWPTTDGEWVGRFREWLDSQFAAMF